MTKEFKEEQRFTQNWLKLILIVVALIPIYGIYKQLIKGEQFGNNPMSDTGLLIFSFFIFGLVAMFWLLKLKTVIDQNEIRFNFFPFVKKTVKWNEVKTAEVVNYGFVGGWGIRFWTKFGTVYNVKGNKGLAIELLNGKKFLIGSQKETELKEVVESVMTAH